VFSRVQPMVFGETRVKRLPHRPAMMPGVRASRARTDAGLWIPPFLAEWYRQAARLIG
jgi:hydrogenase-4 component F